MPSNKITTFPSPDKQAKPNLDYLFDRPALRPGMDFDRDEGMLYLTVPARVLELGPPAYGQFVLRSDGSLFRLDQDTGVLYTDEEGAVVRRATPLNIDGREIRRKVLVDDLADSLAEVERPDLYERVLAKIRSYLLLPEDWQYHLLACWIIGTHLYKVFRKFPLLAFTSREAGSGKTTALKLIEQIAFNAERFNSITDSSLVDTASESACTVILDELELIGRAIVEQMKTKEILNSLFESGSRIRKKEKDTTGKRWIMVDRYLFNPAVIAKLSKGGIPPTIRDRALVVKMKRLSEGARSIQENGEPVDDGDLPLYYKELAAWGLRNAAPVYEASIEVGQEPIGMNRRKDVWKAILSVAKVASKDAFRVLKDVASAPEDLFTEDDIPEDLELVFELLDNARLQGREELFVSEEIIRPLGMRLSVNFRNTKTLCKALESYQDTYGFYFHENTSGNRKKLAFKK